jgi:ATP-dependent 26S proteasome regulatory subunit
MLTAMDVGQLPAALLRSGRVELWLEMRLPDEAGRAAILGHHLSGFPEGLPGVDVGQLADLTPGCTGADLKRLAEDGRNLFASDLVQDKPLRPATAYFLDALATLRANQEKYGKLAGGR